MLARESRALAIAIAEPERAVALRAGAVVGGKTFLQQRAVAGAAFERRPARKARGIGGDVEQVLRALQVVLRGETPHAVAPAPIVPEIGELLDEHRDVLAGDRGNASIVGAEAGSAMACRSSREEIGAVFHVGREPHRGVVVGPGRLRLHFAGVLVDVRRRGRACGPD
jgi:hypothetical protein